MPVPITERVNRLPSLPFLVALVVAALLLSVAFDHDGHGADDRVTTVEEIPRMDPDGVTTVYDRVTADIEIVESGFGMILDEDGDRRGTVGAIVRNDEEDPVNAVLNVRSRIDGTNLVHTRFNMPWIPPGEAVYLGTVFPVPEAVPDASALSLEIDDAFVHIGDRWGPFVQEQLLPEFTVTGTVPLFTPAGARIEFTAGLPDNEMMTFWSPALLFRDESGAIVGGLSPTERPLSDPEGVVPMPRGRSVNHWDVPEHAIPAEADLDQVEIGPSAW